MARIEPSLHESIAEFYRARIMNELPEYMNVILRGSETASHNRASIIGILAACQSACAGLRPTP